MHPHASPVSSLVCIVCSNYSCDDIVMPLKFALLHIEAELHRETGGRAGEMKMCSCTIHPMHIHAQACMTIHLHMLRVISTHPFHSGRSIIHTNVSSHSGRSIIGDISGGLTGRQFRAERHYMARELLNMVEASGAVLIRGPPQSGKTSLMELVQAEAEKDTKWQHVIRISMATGTSLDSVLTGQADTTWADFWGSPRASEMGWSSKYFWPLFLLNATKAYVERAHSAPPF